MGDINSQAGNLFLRLSSSADEKLVAELLGENYKIFFEDSDLSKEIIDLVVVDFSVLNRLNGQIQAAKRNIAHSYLPVMVMIKKGRSGNDAMWEIADDVVEMPVSKKILLTRVKGLVKIRTYSREIQIKKNKLEKRNRQLRLYYNAIEATTSGMVISDPSQEDNPIIFCNKAFTELTGYSQSEVMGENCRFLQNDDREQPGIDIIRKAVQEEEPCDVLLRNYKKDGSLFWNELRTSPIKNSDGEVEYYVGIQNDVTELVKTQKALESAKEQWEGIVSQSPNLIQISVDDEIRFINIAGASLLGFDLPDQVVGKSLYELIPVEQHEALRERLERLKQGKQTSPMIYTMGGDSDRPTYLKVLSIPITYQGQPAAQTVGVDVTSMKESELKLTSLLKQKQVLLQEVHHRVKNNFAIISGLIELQTAGLEDEETISYLRDMQMRIISISKVHEILYKQDNKLHEVEFDQYIEQLMGQIKSTMVMKSKKINISLDMQTLTLSIDQAIPCGLLLNELITNSIKHGFDEGETIKIHIGAVKKDECITIKYRDFGKGMPETPDLEMSGNFGTMIIRILIEQLDAEYKIDTENGMQLDFNFKIAEYRGPSQKLS